VFKCILLLFTLMETAGIGSTRLILRSTSCQRDIPYFDLIFAELEILRESLLVLDFMKVKILKT
jgi:hypothetical protein